MNIEEIREYCLAKKGSTESFPFDNDTLVFKVNNKMFALLSIQNNTSINLKCNPEKSINLREEYQGIEPGFHMNKKHWNTVNYNSDVPKKLLTELIDHSYNLIISKLKLK